LFKVIEGTMSQQHAELVVVVVLVVLTRGIFIF